MYIYDNHLGPNTVAKKPNHLELAKYTARTLRAVPRWYQTKKIMCERNESWKEDAMAEPAVTK